MLVIHTKYRARGGEDIAVQNELEFLKKYYQVEIVYFDNIISNYFKQTVAFLFNKNNEITFNFANLQFLQFSILATCNLDNLQIWQLAILANCIFDNFQS